ncbi:helix-turn-helix transcriptional regulator [Flavobacterium sp. ANB]|uniref:helix-turn-helix transcriptional regulator n=1 Tax=unclassified Flavobacterium TaxID=196869 RepID=UPI0012BA1B8E|nr:MULTISPECIES: helix-turn-helix transcriptional regulator [unclassified Flavobacterium]MBF4515044.1 helix-turn-helix transcriptional regulator [Flavobacterium sp. ANB]MTD69956.1 helix-turn-helix domain-containing protein [Flavobacterium sp. LC2016-13]
MIGFKIKKLREQRDLSQHLLASELNISQSELSKIENSKTKKIDFLLMYKICAYFQKDFCFFIESEKQIQGMQKLEKSINGNEIINLFSDKIIDEIKQLIEENKQKDDLIKMLRGIHAKKGINES